jgi:cytochrome P450 family 4
LTILLEDEIFRDNDKAIVDEIITFFLAGSFTLKSTNSNMLQYLSIYPDVKAKLLKEIKQTVLKEHLSGPNKNKPVDTYKAFTFESVEDLKYFIYCFYESLRMEPPTVTSGGIFSEDVQMPNGITIRKGDQFVINMQHIQNDPEEWQSPEHFMPERFDPASSLYIRPDGKKRHPLAFTPFIGGKRICLGKTFAEVVAKFVVPALLSRLDFDLVDEEVKTGKKPKIFLNLDIDDDPIIMMTVKRANL